MARAVAINGTCVLVIVLASQPAWWGEQMVVKLITGRGGGGGAPAAARPPRFLRRSAARGGQSRNHTPNLRNQHRARAAIRKSGALFEAPSNLNLKALNAAPSRARYTGACEKGERDEEGEPARLARAPAHRKLESQIVLPPPPQPPPGRAAGGLRLRARRPTPRRLLPLSEQGLEHSLWFSSQLELDWTT